MEMALLYVFTFFFEMLISVMFFSNIYQRKYNLLYTLLLGAALFELGAIINIFFVTSIWLNVGFTFIANLSFCLICFKVKKTRAVFYSILLVTISSLIETITEFLASTATEQYINVFISNPVLITGEIVLSKLLYFVVAMFLLRIKSNDNNNVKIPIPFYLFPFITVASVISFLHICITDQLKYRNQVILAVISSMLLLSTILIFFVFQSHSKKENELFVLQQESNRIKTDLLYSEIIEKQNNSLRLYAHDARKHLLAIKELNTNPQIENYISKMAESLDEYSHVSHSGNKILDVLINKCSTECNLNKVNFFFDVKNNNLSDVEYNDIVTIIGNLLDNAIEAATNSDEKYVSLETDFKNEYTVIIVSNSCDTPPKFDNSKLPVTTKKNKSMHGFGLKSVKKAVKKYNGDIEIEYIAERKAFTVTVMLDAKH